MRIWKALFFILSAACFAGAQETERTGLAVEFPELSSGPVTALKSYIPRSDLNVVKFWIKNPAAETIEWNNIKVRINNVAAIVACQQVPAADGKVLRCDLNRFFRFRLQPKQNLFEIEATGTNSKRYFGSFLVLTGTSPDGGPAQAIAMTKQLGFSGRKFAVVMGVSKYRYNEHIPNLEYADDDAEAINAWLIKKGGFSPQDILFLTNENATLSGVSDSLERFLAKAAETDLVLFFLAGHGGPDTLRGGEMYYLMGDSKYTDLANTALRMSKLKEILDRRLRSKRVIFLLDTCHSAGLIGTNTVALAAPGQKPGTARNVKERQLERVEVKNNVSVEAGRMFATAGRAVFTSSDAGETSQESKDWGGGHGVFTWALLEGLNGKADTNRDRVITTEELFRFVSESVRAETGARQNPRLFSNLGGSLEIATLK